MHVKGAKTAFVFTKLMKKKFAMNLINKFKYVILDDILKIFQCHVSRATLGRSCRFLSS